VKKKKPLKKKVHTAKKVHAEKKVHTEKKVRAGKKVHTEKKVHIVKPEQPKKTVHKLNSVHSFDFVLIGISSHEKDYFISWSINKNCSFNLVKTSGMPLKHPKTGVQCLFSLYEYADEDRKTNWRLLSNRADNAFLVDEMSNIDYFLHGKGEISKLEVEELISSLKQTMGVITAFAIDPKKMKSGKRLILD
jgi:hypothetical protein